MIFQVGLKMGKSQRIKGSSFEREIVNKHKQWGVDAKRVPLSGATDYAKHDVQIAGLFGECKIRKDGFKTLYGWLEDEPDFLVCRADRKETMYILPERTWQLFLKWSKLIKDE